MPSDLAALWPLSLRRQSHISRSSRLLRISGLIDTRVTRDQPNWFAPASRQYALSRATGFSMASPSLRGLSILIVEDEPLIGLDMMTALETEGAAITVTTTLEHAKILVEHDGLAAAILDHTLRDGDSSSLCARLKERGIPFIIYSGHLSVEGSCNGAMHLRKPATAEALVAAVEELIKGAQRPQ